METFGNIFQRTLLAGIYIFQMKKPFFTLLSKMTAVIHSGVVTTCCSRRRRAVQRNQYKMNTNIVKLTLNGLSTVNDHVVKIVADLLLKSHIVAVPTDTIYGLAGLAQDNWSVRSIYNAKRRDVIKPLSICVGEIEDIPKWAVVTVSKSLMEDLLPGPVTLVFERTHHLNPNFNPDTNLVGVRIPDNEFMRKVARIVDQPIALTSANFSNANSALSIEEFQDLWPHLKLVVDGGKLEGSENCRLGSTVVDLSIVGHYKILRRGCAYSNTVKLLADKYNLVPIS